MDPCIVKAWKIFSFEDHLIRKMKKSFADLLREHRPFVISFLILMICCLVIMLTIGRTELFLLTNRYHNEFLDRFFAASTFIGDGITVAIVLLGMLFIKYRFAVITAMAYAYSSLVVQILKRVYNSPRPVKYFEDLSPIRTIDGYPLHQWNSFPSGHAASAFTLAVILTYLLPYKNRHWIILPVAIAAAWSRVYLAQHFFQDIFAGAVLGVILTFQMIWWLENSTWYHSSKLDGRLFGKA
jgi:membrane-associated phospholipid phosphatase